MATSRSMVDDLLDRLQPAGRVTALKMFGEYCLYLDGIPVALVCRDTLFIKPTEAGRALVPDVEEAPPFPGIRPYLVVPVDAEGWHAREALCNLLQTTRAALPPAPPRRSRSPRRPARDA